MEESLVSIAALGVVGDMLQVCWRLVVELWCIGLVRIREGAKVP